MNGFTDNSNLLTFDSNHSEFFSNIKFFKRIKNAIFAIFLKKEILQLGIRLNVLEIQMTIQYVLTCLINQKRDRCCLILCKVGLENRSRYVVILAHNLILKLLKMIFIIEFYHFILILNVTNTFKWLFSRLILNEKFFSEASSSTLKTAFLFLIYFILVEVFNPQFLFFHIIFTLNYF